MAETLKERVSTAVAVEYGRGGYVTADGRPNAQAIADKLFPLVAAAVARKSSERATVCITQRGLVEIAFPDVPGPEGWEEQDDPELSKGVYTALRDAVWRLMDISPKGPIQSRLNSDHGLTLVKTKVNPHMQSAVYVTRDLDCILKDIYAKQEAANKRRADRESAITTMLMARIPEHGKKFGRELVSNMKLALDHAKAEVEKASTTTSTEDEQ